MKLFNILKHLKIFAKLILSLVIPILSNLFSSISGYYTNNILNRLKIRTKLILFLIIPVLTILFFSVSGIYTKVQEIQVTKSSQNFTIVSLHLADLVHELQKERGLSAGFVGGGGKSFRKEVLKQRKQTDEKLGLFNQKLDINAPGEDYWGLSDKFTLLQQELSRLPVVRNAINTLNEGNFFDFYSNLNAHALDIIQYLQVFTNDAPLARQGDAYSSLLCLQEHAGQERGALNGIFASGKLDAKLFQEISAYVAEQNTIFNNYYTIVSNEYQDMLRKKMRHPIAIEVEALRSAAIYKARRNELLNDLQMMIGYGGLIHDFKDYVIRGKDWYAEHFSKISVDAKDIIEQYQHLPGMSPEGIANLNSIGTTFDQYQAILKDVTTMKKLGRSIIEIDSLVSIDDKLAIDAIKQLRKDVTSQDTSEWWEKATFRIELIKDVSDAIRSDIVDRTQQIIATTEKAVRLFLILSITNLAISFFLGYLLMRRPVEEIVNISNNMRNMKKQRDFDHRLMVSGHDEISDLADAFNEMIDERKKMEEALLQSEKLKSLGTITAGIAHDFNNILAVISGKVQLLEIDYESSKELKDELSNIMKAIDDGVEISNRMLKFTKTEKNIAGFAPYDIRDLLRQSIDFTMPRWRNMAQAKGISYHIDEESVKEVPDVLCNPTELREIFINIINNALDAMPEGGNISFITWSGEDNVFVDISDTGEGMSEDRKKKIFDPFFSTKGAAGTGLGMSIAYGIITRHGGKIEVESEVGKGSTFKLQFPITGQTVRSMATTKPEQKTNERYLRILVVDDEQAICNILNKILSRSGHKVKTVDNGADAIELIKKEEFDLVLCDLSMPEISGYDVIKVINELEKRPKIGIVTGWGETIEAVDEEGMNVDFIARKPFAFPELTRKINEVFGV